MRGRSRLRCGPRAGQGGAKERTATSARRGPNDYSGQGKDHGADRGSGWSRSAVARPLLAATWDAIHTCVHTHTHTRARASAQHTHARARAHTHTILARSNEKATARVVETDETSAALTAPLRLESARTAMRGLVLQGVRVGRCVRTCACAHGTRALMGVRACVASLGEHPRRTVVRVMVPEQYPEEFGQIDCEAHSDADVDELSRRTWRQAAKPQHSSRRA